MKTKMFVLAGCIALAGASCNNNKARFLDLNNGESVELTRDEKTGLMVNPETGKPVDIYVDTKTHDTIFGRNGKVINGQVVKNKDGDYAYAGWEVKQDGEEYKAKSGDDKIKSEGDEHKVKNGS